MGYNIIPADIHLMDALERLAWRVVSHSGRDEKVRRPRRDRMRIIAWLVAGAYARHGRLVSWCCEMKIILL